MTVSWDEVPCSGQNEPISGYLLYYTNITFSDSVNITGGNNTLQSHNAHSLH